MHGNAWGANIHRSQGVKCMVMLEDQGVPKVSACLRWSQGVLNYQNSPTPRVVLLSIKINTISLKNGFPMKGDGYPMGTHRYHTQKKTITVHFRKWNAHAWRHFVLWNALLHFMLGKNTSKSSRFLWVKGHYPHIFKDPVLEEDLLMCVMCAP